MNIENGLEEAITRVNDNINISANNLDVGCITNPNNKFSLDSDGNLIVNSITANTNSTVIDFNSIYPIGSIYLSVNNTNPSTLFGGTWERIKDKFILTAGDKYAAGSTGGEETHKLTVYEMPTHYHDGIMYPNSSDRISLSMAGNTGYNLSWNRSGNGTRSDIYTTNAGGSQAHNNMPPYLTVYCWKRIS